MTRKECLDQAAQCVLRDRQDQYGGMEDCFISIAELWSAYLRCAIHPYDVACMMALLKVARIQSNPRHADSWTDLAGYAACGAELTDRFYGKVDPSPKAEGCEALVERDAPQTKEELFNRIVDCNPATYGHPHKPTGEELAELAEEDGNA